MSNQQQQKQQQNTRGSNNMAMPQQSYANFLGSSDGQIIEYDVWENQRLSPKDNIFSPEGRVSGDRPPWSTKDGKRAQHRDAFLLPDLTWKWESAWFIATIDGKALDPWEAQNGAQGWLYAPSFLVSTKQCSEKQNPLSLVRRRRWMRRAVKVVAPEEDSAAALLLIPTTVVMAAQEEDSSLKTAPSIGEATAAAVHGGEGGGDDDEHGGDSAAKAAAAFSQKLLETLPHPTCVAHYGYASAPELVASASNSPMLNKEVAAAASPTTSLASRAFSKLKSLNPFGGGKGAQDGSAGGVQQPPQSPGTQPATPARGSFSNDAETGAGNGDQQMKDSFAAGELTNNTGLTGAPSTVRSVSAGTEVSAASLAEVSLLLKHHSTFDVLQTFMAEILAMTPSPVRGRNGGGCGGVDENDPAAAPADSSSAGDKQQQLSSFMKITTLPENIQRILRESGVPQALRAPMWLGFSGALHLKMRNPGKYKSLLETIKKSKRMLNKNDPINLDVARTCSTHPFFCNGRGPGATTLRNILFAFEEMEWRKHREEEDKKREAEVAAQKEKSKATDQIVDELFVAAAAPPASVAEKGETDQQQHSEEKSEGAVAEDEVLDVKNLDKKQQQESLPQVYHQALAYVASIFVMNCQSEEDAFWLLTVMAEQCPLMQSSAEGVEMMDKCVQNFGQELLRRAGEEAASSTGATGGYDLQQALAQVDMTIGAYSWFQALLCAHVSCPVASRLFDIFLINVRDVSAFVDFAVTLVLKCLHDRAALARFLAGEGAGRLDQVTMIKFLNEQMRRVSCDIIL